MNRAFKGVMALSLSLVVAGGGTTRAGASAQAPFRAHFEVAMSLTPDPECGGFRVSGAGAGKATRMGRATLIVDECVDFVREPGRVHVYGSLVLTAANGDEVRVWADKVGDPPGPNGDAHVAGPYLVTAGTGRFSGATGAGITSTDANVVSSTAIAELVGSLRRA
ncbi:MAG TPA: hypothetical protein VM121_09510 [Acidimicrobiales bacterium]|nr:hypothetical protein [Acidimicrobiales bacterium]